MDAKTMAEIRGYFKHAGSVSSHQHEGGNSGGDLGSSRQDEQKQEVTGGSNLSSMSTLPVQDTVAQPTLQQTAARHQIHKPRRGSEDEVHADGEADSHAAGGRSPSLGPSSCTHFSTVSLEHCHYQHSYSREDCKHELHMMLLLNVAEDLGFSESTCDSLNRQRTA